MTQTLYADAVNNVGTQWRV